MVAVLEWVLKGVRDQKIRNQIRDQGSGSEGWGSGSSGSESPGIRRFGIRSSGSESSGSGSSGSGVRDQGVRDQLTLQRRLRVQVGDHGISQEFTEKPYDPSLHRELKWSSKILLKLLEFTEI